jgi:hypothetical protein
MFDLIIIPLMSDNKCHVTNVTVFLMIFVRILRYISKGTYLKEIRGQKGTWLGVGGETGIEGKEREGRFWKEGNLGRERGVNWQIQ